ncbi:hypothetical protein [Pigmentiphaga kullae]|uniref:DUF551 domain-containing protein n=1 Tax=Pigmentiphaga kullae TaxID=151784 RepID=A0A4Q7NCH5_9BURK|nr:hypothetical protein [Pigmentiphaga kullae]RZS80613.1 hypothetical protein EV675_3225 [Pigmentiphaga kullae]
MANDVTREALRSAIRELLDVTTSHFHMPARMAAATKQARAALATPAAPDHIDNVAVNHFAAAMKEKLAQARTKGRSGWHECHPADLSRMLREHVEKGDPRDVANFCMFLWSLGKPISAAPAVQAAPQPPGEALAEENSRLRTALQFYADGDHFIRHDSTAWDTVSGEPPNLYEDEANTATVEDGTFARIALGIPAMPQATVKGSLQVAAPQAGEDAREAKQRVLDAAQWWADQRDLGPRPAKEAWTALAMRIDAELAMLTEGGAPQPAAQAAPIVPLIARALAEWHEDDGQVLWWAWCGHEWAGEAPWCGTPLDSDWPGYHTHWTAIPAMPASLTTQGADRD